MPMGFAGWCAIEAQSGLATVHWALQGGAADAEEPALVFGAFNKLACNCSRVARYDDAQARLANAFRARPIVAADGGAPNLAPSEDAGRAARAVRALEAATPINVGALRKLCTALQAAAAKDGGASLDAEEFLQARGALVLTGAQMLPICHTPNAPCARWMR